jgi:putative ABC transport system substrate-binding protein
MKRREFITLLGSFAAWPQVGQTQQLAKMPVIGFLGSGTPSTYSQWVTAFLHRLHELDRVEGHNFAIEYRWAEGRKERYTEIAAEFVRIRVDVIVAAGTLAALAAKQATSTVPIVFVAVGDPVGTNLVASFARPGGNVTGLSNQQGHLAGKRLELLHEVVPGFHQLAILANTDNPASNLEIEDVKTAARAIGIGVLTFEIHGAEDIAHDFELLSKRRADALYVASDPLLNSNRVRINTLALGARLPTLHTYREYVEAGGLMSYGPSFPDLFRRAGDYVDKILRGDKPSDLPVEQPTNYRLIINLTTATALGLTIPPALLARADEVIE